MMTPNSRMTSTLQEGGFRRPSVEEEFQPKGHRPVDISGYAGRLIAVEGTDGVGRSTQIALLREWLETQGYGVVRTALSRGRLAGEGLRKAKQGTTLGQRTLDLFYATDFADRLENEILPALRAGFVVLTDRYIYSIMGRSIVRGIDPDWLTDLYRFAPSPHAILYLKIDIKDLLPRVLSRGGFDFWESGMDFLGERDLYRSFVVYQTRLLETFDQLSKSFDFHVIDGGRNIADVFRDLRSEVVRVLADTRSAGP